MTPENYKKILDNFQNYVKELYKYDPYSVIHPNQNLTFLNDPKQVASIQNSLNLNFQGLLTDETLLKQNKAIVNKILRNLVTVLNSYIDLPKHPQFKAFLESNLKLIYSKMSATR